MAELWLWRLVAGLTAEVRVRSQISPFEIYERSGTGAGFFPEYLKFSSISVIPSMLHTHHHNLHVTVTRRPNE